MDDASDEAIKQYESIKQRVEAIGASAEKLDFYEDWDTLPVDAYLIDAKIGPKDVVTISGIYIRYPELDPTDKLLQIVRQVSDFSNLPFKWDMSFQSLLSQAISKNIKTYIGDERYSVVNLIKIMFPSQGSSI